jgi:hypothetical protein
MEESLEKQIIKLREQGFTYDEIAEKTGTYKSKVHRVLASVPNNLEQEEEMEQEDGTVWNDMKQEDETTWNDMEQEDGTLEQNAKILRLEQNLEILISKMNRMQQETLGNIQEEKKKVADTVVSFSQKLLEEQIEQFKKEMEHKKLQEMFNELERKYKSLRAKYKAKVAEYDEDMEFYEEQMKKIEGQVKELQQQASVGKNVLEGIKTAVPILIQQKPVQNFLNGLSGQDVTEINNPTQQPTSQEEEFTEEEWEYMNLILDVKEAVKDQFQMVTILLNMFMKDTSKIDEVITFLTQDQNHKESDNNN